MKNYSVFTLFSPLFYGYMYIKLYVYACYVYWLYDINSNQEALNLAKTFKAVN